MKVAVILCTEKKQQLFESISFSENIFAVIWITR